MMLFVKTFWLSLKSIVRRPLVFVFFFVFSLLFYFLPGIPNIRISLFGYYAAVYDIIPRPVASLGEWGRFALLFCSSGGAGFFALFISLLFLAAFWPEIAHKEPLWATPKARFYLPVAKLLAVGVVGALVVTITSLSSLFHPVSLGMFVNAGGSYVPIYFLFTLIQSLFWASFSFLLFSFTRSRLVVVFASIAVSTVWSMIFAWIPDAQKISPLLALVYRSYISWNFVGPYAQFGLIPLALALQALTLMFATIAVLTGGLLTWCRRPEWQGIKHKNLLVFILGTLLAFGAGICNVHEIDRYRAPMPDWDLFATHPSSFPPLRLERCYIWSKDGILIFYPGEYAITRLPLESIVPLLQDVTDKRIDQIHYYDERFSLTIIFPPDSDYPAEIAGVIKYLKSRLQPVSTRAALWKKSGRIIVVPYSFTYPQFNDILDGILISGDILGALLQDSYYIELFLWTLTKSSGCKGCERAYLWIYLLEGFDVQKAQFYLNLLAAKARGERVYLRHFLKDANPDRVLDHWRRGEKLGHANYIHMLLKGAKR